MNNIKLIIFITFLLTLSTIGIRNYFNNSNSEENTKIKESFQVLNECFDLKNKNKRSLNDSIKLIEYCLSKYGYKN